MKLNRFLVVMIFFALMQTIYAQSKVEATITDVESKTLQDKMSENTTKLLTELNKSFFENKTPNLASIAMSNEARQNVIEIWNNSPYRCVETEMYLRCLNINRGFQVRNIPIIVKEGGENQDVVINFSTSGEIVAFYFAISNHRYQEIMQANNSITDMRRRQMILNFIENFRTAYNRKDLDMINAMYSDDALIITGNVYTSVSNETINLPQEKIKYVKQNKEQYLGKLAHIFKVNKYVNIGFDEIDVMQHGKYNDVYGVTLKQAWRTSNYSDDGWLFLAIHFEDDDKMYVDVRTWQPYMLNGEILPKYERISLGDMDF